MRTITFSLPTTCVVATALVLLAPATRTRAQSPPALSDQAAAQIAALMQEKASRTRNESKIDSQVLHAVRRAQGRTPPALANLRTIVAPDASNRVVLDLRARPTPSLLAALRGAGADVLSTHPVHEAVRVRVPLARVDEIAAHEDVLFVAPQQEAATRRRSLVDHVRRAVASYAPQQATRSMSPMVGGKLSEGDAAHLAAQARVQYGVSGAGLRIGILSDGVNGLAISQSIGELPDVTVLPDQAGGGAEGTAMLEIVHDIAPGASLYFATAFGGAARFAQNIRDLRAAGCDIIVDDVYYFLETPFQDGQVYASDSNGAIIAQAVKDVVASGALYFSAAGNEGNKNDGTSGTWEGDFADGGSVTFPATGQIHAFAPGETSVVLTGAGLANTLHWSDPLGGSANDYDVFLLDSSGTTILAASTNVQNGTQDPFEQLPAGDAGSRLVIVRLAGEARHLHLSSNRGSLSLSTPGSIRGHSATTAPGSFAVSASSALSVFPGAFNAGNSVEVFNSDGPRRIFFNESGATLGPGSLLGSGGQVLTKPDLTAADGVTVSGSGGFASPFYGTSASAPHAAAIAALVRSANPAITPAAMRDRLNASAIDIESAGVDRDSGAGIVMAHAAVAGTTTSSAPPPGNWIKNGTFAAGATDWQQFATPDMTHMVSRVQSGRFEFYRVVPADASDNQATIFQATGVALGPRVPLLAQFSLGNSSAARKRISVLVLDSDFSDLAVCTFWLPAGAPLAAYEMRTHTTEAWTNAAIYFYAASDGSNGGYYLLDNVSLAHAPGGSTERVDCVDPLRPQPAGGAAGAEMLVNGDFTTGAFTPWGMFGKIVAQISGGVLEFHRPAGDPAGVMLQATSQPVPAQDIVTATFSLGNSSAVRKRVTVILHDNDFSDLSACTFFLAPGQPLLPYTFRAFTSEPWTNATFSVYPATIGAESWIRVDDVSLRRTPGTATLGSECIEPVVMPPGG
jgi:hypothetical protein